MTLILVSCNSEQFGQKFNYPEGKVILNKITVNVQVTDTFDKMIQGLMYRTTLNEFDGMLFDFSNDQALSFWMKNTTIPLDIIFINSTRHIVKIQEADPCISDPCKTYPSELPARYVVEVNKGFCREKGIKEGDKVQIIL
jgi:uncharacterized protein